MEKLTSDQLLTLMEKTLKDLRSATSSLESVAGAMHSNLQDGNQLDLFGLDHRPVSHSPLQGQEKPKMTNDISGHTSSISSESANLQQYLASRLPQQLEQSGSTIYNLTWKTKVTPRQWQYCQLAASVRRIKENACSSWPTPVASDNRDRGSFDDPSVQRRMRIGKSVELSMMVHSVSPWPTPSQRDYKGGRKLSDGQNVSESTGTRFGLTLDQVPHLLNAETEKPVKSQLNPRFSLWLMGFPIEWAYCGEQVTPLSRKSQRK